MVLKTARASLYAFGCRSSGGYAFCDYEIGHSSTLGVFGGFTPDALKDRILDSDCRVVITADEGIRGNKKIPLESKCR